VKKIISDEFWNCMKDLFPNNQGKPGRPPMNPRKALSGIMFVLENGSKWRFLPSVYGKPTTVHGNFMRWVRNGTFKSVEERAKKFYLSNTRSVPAWYAIDTSSSKAPYANWAGNNPTDRGKHGVKKSIIIDQHGAPLALAIGPANRHDSTFFEETLNALAHSKKDTLKVLAADSAFDAKKLRELARDSWLVLFAATNKRRRRDCEIRKPSLRWKVEASHSWLNNFRSLKTCWVRTKESFFAFLQLGAAVLLFRKGIIFG
jgi:putative transposase